MEIEREESATTLLATHELTNPVQRFGREPQIEHEIAPLVAEQRVTHQPRNPRESVLAQEHLTAVRAKLKELKALERSIAAFVKSCDTSCAGGPGPDCSILIDLSTP